jgi:nonsense-mediated mRNA decay protein 3
MKLICPKCGRGEDQVTFIGAFCVDCYPVRLATPERMELERCKRCGRMLFRGQWVPYDERKICAWVVSMCRGDFSGAEYHFAKRQAAFTISRGGKELKIERDVPLAVKTVMCTQCNRISGGYYEGIIQLRGNRARVEKHARQLMERLEKKTFIAKAEEKDGGMDIYAGSSKAALEAVTALGARALITRKLIGRDQGKKLYRTTFAIRL